MKVVDLPKIESKKRQISPKPPPIVRNPLEKWWLKIQVYSNIILVAFKHLRSPLKVIQAIAVLKKKVNRIYGKHLMPKIARVDGKYYWRLNNPGFPSAGLNQSLANEINRIIPFRPNNGLGVLFLGITKRCPLSCEHCLEWDRLNQKEILSRKNLIDIMIKFQDYGATQIQLSGGEPLLRIDDIYAMLQNARKGTDFWINTSGWKFNAEQAALLKKYGLTGIMVSLDHHIAEHHDRFRGKTGSFDMALNAVAIAREANLVTALTLCPTQAYTNEENLLAYLELAKQLGVAFVQFYEPKPVGRYKDKDIMISREQEMLLEKLYIEFNSLRHYRDYPIINHINYQLRRTGCFGAGDYVFYIDTNGDAHNCPGCQGKVCNVLDFPAEDTVNLLKQTGGCHFFDQYEPETLKNTQLLEI